MTEQQITELLHRAADHYLEGGDAGGAADRAITGGRRRRTVRRGVAGVAVLAVLGAAGTGVGLVAGHHSTSASSLIATSSDPIRSVSPEITAAWPATLHDAQVIPLPSGATATFYQVHAHAFPQNGTAGAVDSDALSSLPTELLRPLPGGIVATAAWTPDRQAAQYATVAGEHGKEPSDFGTLVGSADATAADFTALHDAYPKTLLGWMLPSDVVASRKAAERAEGEAPAAHPVTVDLRGWICTPITNPKDYGSCSGPGGVTIGLSYAALGTPTTDSESGFDQIGTVAMMGGAGRILRDPSASPLESSDGTTSGAVTGVQIDGPALADGVYVEVFAPGPGPWATVDDLKAVAGAITWK